MTWCWAHVAVETHLPAYTFSEFFEHQLRWARTTRDARRSGYLGLLLTFGLPWAMIARAARGRPHGGVGLRLPWLRSFALLLLCRWALAWSMIAPFCVTYGCCHCVIWWHSVSGSPATPVIRCSGAERFCA